MSKVPPFVAPKEERKAEALRQMQIKDMDKKMTKKELVDGLHNVPDDAVVHGKFFIGSTPFSSEIQEIEYPHGWVMIEEDGFDKPYVSLRLK